MNSKALKQSLSFRFDRAWVRPGALLVVLALAVPFSLAADEVSNDGQARLIGTWNFHAVLDCDGTNPDPFSGGCPFPSNEFDGVETFNSDGTMHVVTSIPDVTIGSGAWKKTGPLTYTFTFTFYRARLPFEGPGLMVPVVVHENLRKLDKNNYVIKTLIRVVLEGGLGTGDFTGTVMGTRYPFASSNTTLP